MSDRNSIEALAEAWASINGRLDEFRAGKYAEDIDGHYEGHMADAAELVKRLEKRGFVIVAVKKHPVVA